MTISNFRLTALTMMFAASSAMVASAADSQNEHPRDDSHHSQKSQHHAQKKSQDSKQSANDKVDPKGWVTVASDYNNDGFYDTIETIYYYDFEKAREASQQRKDKKNDHTSDEQSQKPLARKASVQGEITSLETIQSKGGPPKQLIATVKTDNNKRARVCLGPADKLSDLKLDQGDTVSAQGVVTRKDGKPVLLAAKVNANGKSVTHKLTKRSSIKRLEGQVARLQEAKSNRSGDTYCIADVETGWTTVQVHLGPKQQLSALDLEEGDKVKMLVRKGNVRGKASAIALEISANDETVKVMPPKQGSRDKSQDKRRNRDD